MLIVQVFECIQALLKSDQDVTVRRSAAVCATLLLRGLSKDCLKVVPECFYASAGYRLPEAFCFAAVQDREGACVISHILEV